MREEDVQRYGRQILLRELGGRGQTKLMSRGVEVRGSGPALDDAQTYLALGGTPLRAGADSVVLTTDPRAVVAADLVVLGDGVAWRSAPACADCWASTIAALRFSGVAPVAVGALAALAVQRLILGWADPLGLVTWDGGRFIRHEAPACARHQPV